MVSILLIRAGQDIALRPLASFLQPVWNSLNRLPLHRWLQSDYDDQYRNRMHALGNIGTRWGQAGIEFTPANVFPA